MKKVLGFLFSLSLVFLFLGNNAEAASPSVYIDGKSLTVSTATVNNSTLVPLRAITEKLGLTVSWNQSTQTITVTHPHRSLKVIHKIGTTYSHRYVNGAQDGGAKYMATESVVQDGITYVPIRFFENLDAEVYWNGSANRIDVYSYELKMNQYLILASLAYNKLDSYANNATTLNNVIPELTVGYKKQFDLVKSKLYIYTDYTTHSDFASEMLMKDWVVKTLLKKEDFATTEAYNKYLNSGFTGYAFRNIKTNEVVIAYRGSDTTIDWTSNAESYATASHQQKPYALQLFTKALSGTTGKVTIVGHSLGGNLAQGVAAYYPYNYDKMVTFNAYGSGLTPSTNAEYAKATNYVIDADIVKDFRNHYGKVIKYKVRPYASSSLGDAHRLFNFYSYYFKANSKYWNLDDYGVPTY